MLAGAGITAISMRFIPENARFSQPSTTGSASPTTQPPVNLAAANNPNFITKVVNQAGAAVVRIDSTQTIKNPQAAIFDDPFFRQFFGPQFPQVPPKQVLHGIGSGFILNKDGEILTNAHVVKGVKNVTVTLKDGRTFKGTVVGADPVTDVGVVKISGNNLPTEALGNSEQLQPGEWVIAIGNPLGLDNTVTQGIVSATGRASSLVGMPDERVNYIQTDAAINPGNSGGPLLNAQGQVIGINTAIIQNTQGLGFAIPINTALGIANQIVTKGKVEHPYIGISMLTLTPEVKQELNSHTNSPISVEQSSGVLVAKVLPSSPAASSGLRAGDVIIKANNQPLSNANDLQQIVEKTGVGVAALLAFVLRTSLQWLHKIFKWRWVAVITLLALIVGFGAFIGLVLIPNFIVETQILLTQLPNYVSSFKDFASSIHNQWNFIPDFSEAVAQLKNYLGQALVSFPLVLTNTFGETIQAIGTIILAIYMAHNPNSVIRGILRVIPRRHHNRFWKLLQAASVRLRGWIFGLGVAMLFVGVGAGIGLSLIGVPLSLSFAVFAGLFEVIPYFGSIAGTLLPALVALTTPNDLTKAVLVLVLFFILNQVDAHLIQPLIVGKRADLNPIAVIIAFLVMGELFGFLGILLAVPAAAVFITLIDEFTPKLP
jgi:S1-C subfamily serine protease/predicted PurR-regulated permease PerM